MTTRADILERILARKTEEISARKARRALWEVRQAAAEAAPARGFTAAVRAHVESGRAAVVAEIKKASPSQGVIRNPFDPADIARSYAGHGAACLSVLTDRDFFQGDDSDLTRARDACRLPVLRKDFMIDPYQIYESRAIGADCVLLIVAALRDDQLQELAGVAGEVGLDVLVEIHDREELGRVRRIGPALIGINNRDLRTFRTSLDTTLSLLPEVPDDVLVMTESGIYSRADVALMQANGVHAFLVGEAFMRAEDPGERLAELFGFTSEAAA